MSSNRKRDRGTVIHRRSVNVPETPYGKFQTLCGNWIPTARVSERADEVTCKTCVEVADSPRTRRQGRL